MKAASGHRVIEIAAFNGLTTVIAAVLARGVDSAASVHTDRELDRALELFGELTGASGPFLQVLRDRVDQCQHAANEERRAQSATALWSLLEEYRDDLIEASSPRPSWNAGSVQW